MNTVPLNQFRDNLPDYLARTQSRQTPLKVVGDNGSDFVVMAAKDWEQLQETLNVLQNSHLMQQIARSLATHHQGQGYQPSNEEMNEILGF
ncbi:type II toxin-antitoxin system Phd/YefM family antitoxin [Sodalinema gerasimenkoae]|uniref:type II toxin-antitoxin system Phd/YefM family antitoxin n=1 Tax=Sodalinema gerasimenkoae TaxID=2862348 RepID=UPI0013567D36|nr:type II toxin-antitoxin system Phd/YefM family antitoxin [Sodalinema gerasimenkoae]